MVMLVMYSLSFFHPGRTGFPRKMDKRLEWDSSGHPDAEIAMWLLK